MSYRTSSQPAGAGAGRRNYSSIGSTSTSTFGSYGARPSSYGTSGLSTSSPSTSTTTTSYRPSYGSSSSYATSTTNRDSYGGGISGMGSTTYSSGPQFDSHGHNINRGTTTSTSTSGSSYLPSTTSSAVNSRLYGPTTTATTSYSRPSSRLENDNYRFSSEMHDATKRLMDAAAESSNNSRQYNSALLPPTRSALSSGTSANAIDRNPLQFSSAVYDNNNQDASPLSNSSSSTTAASSPSSAYSQSPYYHERTGAHSHLLNQPLSRRDELSSNASSNSRSNRNASAAASSHRHRRSVEEYASGFGTTSAAYGAAVNQSTPTSNRFAPTQAQRQALRQQAEDSDEETDGPHISLAMKQNSSSSYSGIHAKSPTANSSSTRQTIQAPAQPPVGLRNIGNTCYMNSALQNIIHSSGDFFSSLPFATKESASGKSKLTKALLALAKSSNIQDLMTVKSGAATLNHEFHGGRQNDAHEFIREFIHALHIELNRVGKAPYKEMKDIEGESDADAAKRWFAYYRSHDDSIVTDYFGGFMRSTTVCGHCKHRSLSFSPVWDLSISMKSGANSIPEMINDYMKIQDLSEFHCEKCKKKRAGKRQSMLVNWPRVLVLQLCRFTYSGARNSQTIDFPARLDQTEIPMSKNGSSLSGGEPVNGYSLAGVVLHKGTANFGHYTAFVKPSGSRTWYNCDDSLVNTVSENEVLRYRTEAYLLFYTMD